VPAFKRFLLLLVLTRFLPCRKIKAHISAPAPFSKPEILGYEADAMEPFVTRDFISRRPFIVASSLQVQFPLSSSPPASRIKITVKLRLLNLSST
jgi:hypothetical protein